MKRKFTYTICEPDHQLRTELFLRRHGYSAHLLTQLKKSAEYLQRNGRPCRLKEILSSGDLLTVVIPEEPSSSQLTPILLPLDIPYEDDDILIVNKPAGLPIHPSAGNASYSLANALTGYFNNRQETFIFRCCNRLDRDTSGLTVVAKHMLSASLLSDMSVHHKIQREYLAIVKGHITPSSGTICAPLSRKPGPVLERVVDFTAGEPAVTHYQVLNEKNGYSLVSLRLETGRTHQIRIHMKFLGFPLIGDYLYNPDMEVIHRQALHSFCLRFRHPVTGADMHFTAPLPEDMRRIIE